MGSRFQAAKNMLLVNYWDSTLGTVPLDAHGDTHKMMCLSPPGPCLPPCAVLC